MLSYFFIFSFFDFGYYFFYTLIEVIITKIQPYNTDSFSSIDSYKVEDKSLFGEIILRLVDTDEVFFDEQKLQEWESMLSPFSAKISLDEINGMNLILNDHDCSDTFFQDVIKQLREDGIQFTITRDNININENNATIITLDQQYSAGPGTLVFAPYNNTRVGHSDSLALAMNTAFSQNGFIVGDILCGQAGYKQDEDGTIHTFFPTDTECAIDETFNSSFVTISFGTQNQNGIWVAKSIENGLARQKYYLKGHNNSTDLIYRANTSDSIDEVANYFGADIHQLKSFNHIKDSSFQNHQTIVNPSIENRSEFNPTSLFQIDNIKTRAY